MNMNGPQQEINYRTPGASEEHPLLYADRSAFEQAQKQRANYSLICEAGVFYVKAILLLGTLVMAYVVFRPQF